MTKSVTTVLGAVLVLAGATAVQAQETKPIGLSIRAGLFFPQSGDSRNAEGDSWFAGGVEFKVRDLNWQGMGDGYQSHLSVSLDTIGKGEIKNIPLLLNYTARANEWYYTGGLGVSFSAFDGNDRMRLAFQVGVGYDFTQGKTPFFLEAKYWGSGKSEFTGFGVYAGIRL